MSLFLQDWNVVSPAGVGRNAFADTFAQTIADARPLSWGELPEKPLFEQFDKKLYLGKKGVRGMDGLGAYATVASHLLAQDSGVLAGEKRERVGVVLGTGSGSLKSQIEFIRDLHVQERVEWVNPIQFPQTVMNCAAGQVSIWHGYTGVNATVSAGHHSGTAALEYSANLLRQDRADVVLAGCAEEYCDYSKFLFPDDERRLRQRQHLGEGCAIFLVAGRRRSQADPELFGYRRMAYLRRWDRERQIEHLASFIDECLKKRDALQCGLSRICFNGYTDAEAAFIADLRKASVAARRAQPVCSNAAVADCLSATAGFQLALLLVARACAGEQENTGSTTDLAVTFASDGGVSITFLQHGENR